MPFILSDKPCEVTFTDKISGCDITFFYRLPTTEERAWYANSIVVRKKKKVETKIGTTRFEGGLKVVTGFKEGNFATEKGLISSDPDSLLYEPGWKGLITKFASHLLMALGAHVFESVDVDEEEEAPAAPDAGDGGKDEGEASPLPKTLIP